MKHCTPLLRFLLPALLLTPAARAADDPAPAKVVDLRCESQSNPQSVNNPLPRFSWRIESEERGLMQGAYRILVASSAESLSQDKGDLWDSGKISSRQTQFVDYGGAPLVTGQQLFWKVSIQDRTGRTSPWSEEGIATIRLSGPSSAGTAVDESRKASLSTFECGDPALDAIFNQAAAQIPTITETRDLGYLLRGIGFHYELLPQGRAWIRTIQHSVDDAGFYPASVPSSGEYGSTRSDAAIWCTHALWITTGDAEFVTRYWPTMLAYVLKRRQLDMQMEGVPFGELPDDTLPEGDPTPASVVHFLSQAFNVRLMIEMAQVASQNPFEMKILLAYQEELATTFQREHLNPDGSLKYASLTAVLMALRSELLGSDANREANKDLFLKLLEHTKSSPFAESPFVALNVLPVLSWSGRHQQAIQLAMSQDFGELTPLAAIAISEWLVASVGGITGSEPGFSGFHLAPQIQKDGPIRFAKATFRSPHGVVRSHWFWEDQTLCYDLTVPPNTLASVRLPQSASQELREGGREIAQQKLVFAVTREENTVEFRVAPGTYKFTVSSP